MIYFCRSMEKEFLLVQKEEVADFHFPKKEVLTKDQDISALKQELSRANALGNLERHKVVIYFADDSGDKKVNTTIWGITDTAVLLKKNVVIPINRIYKLEI